MVTGTPLGGAFCDQVYIPSGPLKGPRVPSQRNFPLPSFLSLINKAYLSSDRGVVLWPYTMAIANLLSVMFFVWQGPLGQGRYVLSLGDAKQETSCSSEGQLRPH